MQITQENARQLVSVFRLWRRRSLQTAIIAKYSSAEKSFTMCFLSDVIFI